VALPGVPRHLQLLRRQLSARQEKLVPDATAHARGALVRVAGEAQTGPHTFPFALCSSFLKKNFLFRRSCLSAHHPRGFDPDAPRRLMTPLLTPFDSKPRRVPADRSIDRLYA